MNERMLDLARQAGLKKHPSEDREYIGDFDWREFGRLVAQECATVVSSVPPCHGDYRDQIEVGMRDYCANKVLEHFGVK